MRIYKWEFQEHNKTNHSELLLSSNANGRFHGFASSYGLWDTFDFILKIRNKMLETKVRFQKYSIIIAIIFDKGFHESYIRTK